MSTETTLMRTNAHQVTEVKADAHAPLSRSATGYGGKIATRYWINYAGRWRRVWAAVYGNAASLYLVVDGYDAYLDIDTEHMLEGL